MITIPTWASAKYGIKGLWAAMVGLLILTSVAVAVVMTVRIHGFKLWPIHIEGYAAKLERVTEENRALKTASVEAGRLQVEAKERAEKQYRDLAERIDASAELQADAIAGSVDEFISRNGLLAKDIARCTAAARAAAAGLSAGNGEAVRGAPVVDAPEALLVPVPANDVRVCTANTLQAEAARAWALELEKSNADSQEVAR